jgi:hypothetical protein
LVSNPSCRSWFASQVAEKGKSGGAEQRNLAQNLQNAKSGANGCIRVMLIR